MNDRQLGYQLGIISCAIAFCGIFRARDMGTHGMEITEAWRGEIIGGLRK